HDVSERPTPIFSPERAARQRRKNSARRARHRLEWQGLARSWRDGVDSAGAASAVPETGLK
ncbi:hypothetical protein, partial [Actinoplanes campanulatus]|uniref:hypothetical protein n=1 Tax=Actinoplanes campanulatus TaxID=113559 RepID=UPI001C859548